MQMVAREMEVHSSLTREQIETAILGVTMHLMERASMEIQKDAYSEDATRLAIEFQAIAEMINMFGSQLIAFEDIELEDSGELKN